MDSDLNARLEKSLTGEKFTMTTFSGVIIALFPIFAPYDMFGISIDYILGFLFVLCHLVSRRSFAFLPKTRSLVTYTCVSLFLSLNGFFLLKNTSNLINSEIGIVLDLIIYMTLWYYSDIDVTMKCCNFVGYICCGYAIVQVCSVVAGKPVPLGQLPFFELATGWVPSVWGFRFNSLFSEPSYFSIYLLPLFVYNLLERKRLNAALFACFIVLSSSSLGIISLVLVLLARFFGNDISIKKRIVLILLCVVGAGLVGAAMTNMPILRSFVSRSCDKIKEIILSISDGSYAEDIRLGGYLYLFEELPIKEQLFGVGSSQLQNYFSERGLFVYNYSNSFVLSLLNFGLLGFVVFLFFLMNMLWVAKKEKTILFWIILILSFAVDSLLFSYRYYWLVYFIMFSNRRKEALL